MSREILFHGKLLNSGEWIEGDLLHNDGYTKIREQEAARGCVARSFTVDPATVGQYIERNDKNRRRIFDGDRVKCRNHHGNVEGVIRYHKGYPYLACSSGFSDEYLFNCDDIEIIGNIHDEGGPI